MANHPTRLAVVTGASRGLGRAISETLAQDGFAVAVNYARNAAAAEETVAAITAAGGVAFPVKGDVSDLDDLDRMFAEIDAWSSANNASLAAFVNNAGVDMKGVAFEATTAEQFDGVFGVNVRGPFFATQRAAARMDDGGAIVNVSSALARKTFQSQSVYGASKAAVNALTLHWAGELGPRGVRVNAVAPGAVDTDLNADWIRSPEGRAAISGDAALRRVGQPEDIAAAVAMLVSDRARWVTGEVIEVSGGWRL